MAKRNFKTTEIFSKQLADRLESGEDILELARHLHLQLVEATPRDTGVARSNWFFNKGEQGQMVDTDLTDPTTSQKTLPKKMSANGDLYLYNNLPYILRLENGWSMQRPNGFLKTSIYNARQNFLSAVRAKAKIKQRV